MAWLVQHERGGAEALHHRELGDGGVLAAAVTVLEVERPALVLGSTQSDGDVDVDSARHLGIEVARRRSGGGAVLLDDGVLWVDVDLPRSDERWTDDVSRSALWLGDAWVAALDAIGVPGATVHAGPMVSPPIAEVLCFAGLAPGEVTVAGAKVVGISQRRTRAGARFQCSVPSVFDLDLHRRLLAPGLERTDSGSHPVPVHPAGAVDRGALVGALVDALGPSL